VIRTIIAIASGIVLGLLLYAWVLHHVH